MQQVNKRVFRPGIVFRFARNDQKNGTAKRKQFWQAQTLLHFRRVSHRKTIVQQPNQPWDL